MWLIYYWLLSLCHNAYYVISIVLQRLNHQYNCYKPLKMYKKKNNKHNIRTNNFYKIFDQQKNGNLCWGISFIVLKNLCFRNFTYFWKCVLWIRIWYSILYIVNTKKSVHTIFWIRKYNVIYIQGRKQFDNTRCSKRTLCTRKIFFIGFQ